MVELENNCNFMPLASYNWSLAPALVPVALPWNPTAYCLIAAFCAVSLWMTVELTIQVFFTFKRHKGLYFWSILVCTWGVTFHVLGLILKLFAIGNWILSSILFKIGWVSNVTGFSLVLYSRLHLVVRDRRILHSVLAMIIIDAFLLHIPIIVCDFGISSPHPWPFIAPMKVFEKIQVTWFSVQETIISSLYIWATSKFLKDTYTKQTHRVMLLLVSAQVLSILFDIALITVDWENMFTLKVVIHPFIYAVKLKIEFIVLNQLLALIKHGLAPGSFPAPDEESPDHSDPTPVTTGKHVSFLSADTGNNSGGITRSRDFADPRDYGNNGHGKNQSSTTSTLVPVPIIKTHLAPDPDEITPVKPPESTDQKSQMAEQRSQTPASSSTPRTSTPRTSFTGHMPARSISDPTPLNITLQEHGGSTDEILTEIERQYLGRSGLRRVSMAEP